MLSHKRHILPHVIKFTPKRPSFGKQQNLYGFDLDHTIIKPKGTNSRFSRNADDWEFISFNEGTKTIDKLIEIVKEDVDAQILIFSNQGGVISLPNTSKSCVKFVTKIENILKAIGTLPEGEMLLSKVWIYASTKKPASLFGSTKKGSQSKSVVDVKKNSKVSKPFGIKPATVANGVGSITPEVFDEMRKPRIGMFNEFMSEFKSEETDIIKYNWKYYCGDAGGRKNDFSDSDKVFAANLEVEFKLPEEIFI
ncbi:hypothetical protein Kpol_1032p78 [Vanderwaltozyma polyspora DSM 70294]|uniref:DNA 3'-phosphatase n=1 Tax=Vanderwaltozyma polyspora (strain ATCC 22028 / DSM 70294 / BCRC 21397 / CBS 2163 / NBRC 10782 / NRRL Y-8283 / UCD 57-17) TaxID=436907 RepID=A7TH29_VANPO|nr:uncharacterized protein Kpol_1032p78 [Vanderwaltozyma polyspora DSM 70294]EDO18481.1 hypothetical protein Kpol_1032p78 [Vanderwaltozyma polyspora DSM 70294]